MYSSISAGRLEKQIPLEDILENHEIIVLAVTLAGGRSITCK